LSSSWQVASDESTNGRLDVATVVIFIVFIEQSCVVHIREGGAGKPPMLDEE
jgi:hypothetical protein